MFTEIANIALLLSAISFLILLIPITGRLYLRHKACNRQCFIGEDSYQHDRVKLNGEAYIFVRLEYKPESVSEEEIESRVTHATHFIEKYFIEHHPEVFEKKNGGIRWLDDIMIEKEEIEPYDVMIASKEGSIYTPRILRFVYSKKERIIIMVFNHLFLGSALYVNLGNIFTTNRMATQLIRTPYTPFFTELIACRFLLTEYLPRKLGPYLYISKQKKLNHNFKPLIRHDNINQLDRFTGNITVADIHDPEINPGLCIDNERIPTRILLIYEILSRIINALPKERISVIIPFAFDIDPAIFNNVGAIMLTFRKGITLRELYQDLKNKYYHVIATNYLMNFMNKGREARNGADVVLTMAYAVTRPEEKNQINKIAISFRNRPDYGLYVSSYTVSGIAHVTITNTAKELNHDKIMADHIFKPV